MNSAFFEGFEKQAYDYAWEIHKREQHAKRRQGDTPIHAGKATGVGALIGGAAGGAMGGMAGGLGGAGVGLLAGTAIGALGGYGVHASDKHDINDAKRVMSMDPDMRTSLLRHRSRMSEESRRSYEQQAAMNNAAMLHASMTRQN